MKKNNNIGIKVKHNGNVVVQSKAADTVEITVARVNSEGGACVARFTKEKDSGAIKRVAMAKEHRLDETSKARNGAFKNEARSTFDATEAKKTTSFFGGKKEKKEEKQGRSFFNYGGNR